MDDKTAPTSWYNGQRHPANFAFHPGLPVTDAAGVKGIIVRPAPSLRTWMVMDVNYNTYAGYDVPHPMHEDDLEIDMDEPIAQAYLVSVLQASVGSRHGVPVNVTLRRKP